MDGLLFSQTVLLGSGVAGIAALVISIKDTVAIIRENDDIHLNKKTLTAVLGAAIASSVITALVMYYIR